ncbi:MAG: formylglycine-generating enzyme family protein [Desulfobulbaceae bacterium]|nr:formylglycine-generating enzyme family protein [Desulfobulbaceae bacterium]
MNRTCYLTCILVIALFPTFGITDQNDPSLNAALHKSNLSEIEMVAIKGDCFEMGCGDWTSECAKDEKPVHEVCVDDFELGKYEVTQGLFRTIMNYNPSTFPFGEKYPVETITWDEATDFIRKLNVVTGKRYRLPTEAEWEYAARSGGKNEIYAGGSNYVALSWCSYNSDKKTHPVGDKTVNGLGLHDMSGNVSEWVWDRYQSDYYRTSPRDNPSGPTTGPGRIYRGGCWGNVPGFLRVTARNWSPPDLASEFIGLRLALSD